MTCVDFGIRKILSHYQIVWIVQFVAIRITAGLLNTGYNRCIAHVEYSNIL